MEFIRKSLRPIFIYMPLFLFSFNPAFGSTQNCPVAHKMSLDLILEDEGLLGDLNENSRIALNGWAIAKIERFAQTCGSEASMEHYGLDVRNGLRRLVWDLEAGEWRHTRWLRRHGVITTVQLRELFAIPLTADADANAQAALRVLKP